MSELDENNKKNIAKLLNPPGMPMPYKRPIEAESMCISKIVPFPEDFANKTIRYPVPVKPFSEGYGTIDINRHEGLIPVIIADNQINISKLFKAFGHPTPKPWLESPYVAKIIKSSTKIFGDNKHIPEDIDSIIISNMPSNIDGSFSNSDSLDVSGIYIHPCIFMFAIIHLRNDGKYESPNHDVAYATSLIFSNDQMVAMIAIERSYRTKQLTDFDIFAKKYIKGVIGSDIHSCISVESLVNTFNLMHQWMQVDESVVRHYIKMRLDPSRYQLDDTGGKIIGFKYII